MSVSTTTTLLAAPPVPTANNHISRPCAGSQENPFGPQKVKIEAFSKHLRTCKDNLVAILATYQSHATSEDEFMRIFECLSSIEDVSGYLAHRTGSVAVFFPLNMPIYAFVLYGIFPALVADRVFIRAPQRMTGLMKELVPVLDLPNYFPNIHVVFESREEFVHNHVVGADVNIFTGKLSNAQYVMSKTRKDSLFIFNGWGCNPIVVGRGADLELAAAKTVEARLFSSGQDCAGPDTILVHRQDVDAFIQNMKNKLEAVRVGQYTDPDVVVGPLADNDQIRLISSILLRSSPDIVHGGTIDFKSSIIYPTIIVCPLRIRMNFEELFAPVLFVNVYDNDAQLSEYFEHPQYITNEMYVSLFGRSEYVETLKRSIVVRNQVVFDIDRGNDEFGGFSIGASFVATCRKVTPKPILIPRDIFEYLEPGSAGYKHSPSSQRKISKQVRQKIQDTFGANLVFGFVFGSVARESANGTSDINTMVVVNQLDNVETEQFTQWLRNLHQRLTMSFKEPQSAIIISRQALDEALESLEQDLGSPVSGEDNNISLYIEALSGSQSGVSGDKKLSVHYGRLAMKHCRVFRQRRAIASTVQGKQHDQDPAQGRIVTVVRDGAMGYAGKTAFAPGPSAASTSTTEHCDSAETVDSCQDVKLQEIPDMRKPGRKRVWRNVCRAWSSLCG